ncbi:hypothetical protein E3N88_01007 [Mikania micrantha]|uniref:CCHC-type domain-containing protein n=1 Tax=Mikania micrantha TaxID=192012 RepID=A0A5N6Q1N3_9ASTR|nr:hypothetical protein E3N88_01007 [Mikania micrantha]
MSNLSKLEFASLDISGNNYLPWTLDAKIHLTAKNLGETNKDKNQTSLQEKSQAMIFLRHHLHEDLKREYLTDYKSVSEYNSALFRITSELKLCGEPITDADMLEKTFSTFHASNMILSQQYRERQFTKYSELISCLLVAEQNNKLLLQNHQSRPVGSRPFPKANVASYHSSRGRGRGRGPSRGRGRGWSYSWKRESHNYKHDGGSESSRHNSERPSRGRASGTQNNICFKCGMSNHWSRTCRTPKHLVEAYQRMIKDKGKNVETNLLKNVPNFSSSEPLSDTYLDACDFIENVRDV